MKNIITISLIIFLFVGCALKEPKVLKYKQSIDYLIKDIKPLHVEMKNFESKYFMPWSISSIQLIKDRASWANIAFKKSGKYYGENLLPWNADDIEKIIDSTNFDGFNTELKFAITIKNAQIRNLPTHKPFFRKTNLPGEGYPFDYMQNSRIHVNTPLFISHFSTDGSWAFVQSPFSTGWLPSESLVLLNPTQRYEFRNAKKIAIIKENVPIYSKAQKYITHAELGAIFPYVKEDDVFYYSYMYANTLEDFGKKISVRIVKSDAGIMPLVFNAKNISQVSTQLLGEKYGWGGYLANRDCSAMTKDFFAPFGMWLPRNSAAQKNAGTYISLKGLGDKEKEQMILENAIPFLSLIYLKGHIMLYIGEYKGKAMVMHNIWGIRTQTNGKESRYIIGKAIISDLYIGANLDNVKDKSLLIHRVEGIMIKPEITKFKNNIEN